ncbi:MAG: hypothetical protein C5B49_12475 [Bdellovibrio sp.]|nr:MAG: hypothetical protein C5B49_12475 [Bdellovibrio sp.]
MLLLEKTAERSHKDDLRQLSGSSGKFLASRHELLRHIFVVGRRRRLGYGFSLRLDVPQNLMPLWLRNLPDEPLCALIMAFFLLASLQVMASRAVPEAALSCSKVNDPAKPTTWRLFGSIHRIASAVLDPPPKGWGVKELNERTPDILRRVRRSPSIETDEDNAKIVNSADDPMTEKDLKELVQYLALIDGDPDVVQSALLKWLKRKDSHNGQKRSSQLIDEWDPYFVRNVEIAFKLISAYDHYRGSTTVARVANDFIKKLKPNSRIENYRNLFRLAAQLVFESKDSDGIRDFVQSVSLSKAKAGFVENPYSFLVLRRLLKKAATLPPEQQPDPKILNWIFTRWIVRDLDEARSAYLEGRKYFEYLKLRHGLNVLRVIVDYGQAIDSSHFRHFAEMQEGIKTRMRQEFHDNELTAEVADRPKLSWATESEVIEGLPNILRLQPANASGPTTANDFLEEPYRSWQIVFVREGSIADIANQMTSEDEAAIMEFLSNPAFVRDPWKTQKELESRLRSLMNPSNLHLIRIFTKVMQALTLLEFRDRSKTDQSAARASLSILFGLRPDSFPEEFQLLMRKIVQIINHSGSPQFISGFFNLIHQSNIFSVLMQDPNSADYLHMLLQRADYLGRLFPDRFEVYDVLVRAIEHHLDRAVLLGGQLQVDEFATARRLAELGRRYFSKKVYEFGEEFWNIEVELGEQSRVVTSQHL